MPKQLNFLVDKTHEQLMSHGSLSSSSSCVGSVEDDDDGYNLHTQISCDELNIELDMEELNKVGYNFSIVDPLNRRSYVFTMGDAALGEKKKREQTSS